MITDTMLEEKKKSLILNVLTEENNEGIARLIESVNRSEMSSIKRSLNSIIRVIADPNSSVKELTEVIQLDPPLTARVLKTANSAFYSRSFTKTFEDIEQAIIWMGSDVIKELALSQKVCEIFKDDKFHVYSPRELWKHSVSVAKFSKMIYRKEFGQKGDNVYVAGLLHDIGLIAENQFLPKQFDQVIRTSIADQIDISESEKKVLGYTHAQVGKAIALSWDLPDDLVLAIGYHTDPTILPIEDALMAATLFTADYYCQNNCFCYGAFPINNNRLFQRCLKLMKVKPLALDIIFKSVIEEVTAMTDKGII